MAARLLAHAVLVTTTHTSDLLGPYPARAEARRVADLEIADRGDEAIVCVVRLMTEE